MDFKDTLDSSVTQQQTIPTSSEPFPFHVEMVCDQGGYPDPAGNSTHMPVQAALSGLSGLEKQSTSWEGNVLVVMNREEIVGLDSNTLYAL